MKSNLWKRLLLVGLIVVLTALVAQVVLAQDSFASVIAISPLQAGETDDGVAYDAYDIVARDAVMNGAGVGADDVTYVWYKLFDGEEFGLGPKHKINGISIQPFTETIGVGCGLECVNYIMMTFGNDAIGVPGITGKVTGQDIVVFEPHIAPTNHITGSFELVFDGSDVGLTTDSEKIDSLDYWPAYAFNPADVDFPNDCTIGVFFISTASSYRVPAANGGSLAGGGSDILMFCLQQYGSVTKGYWFRGFDADDVPLNPTNAMNGIDIAQVYPLGSTEEDEEALLYYLFTAKRTFTANGVAGGPGEVYAYPGCSYDDFFGPVADLNDTEPSLNGVAGGFDAPYYLALSNVCS